MDFEDSDQDSKGAAPKGGEFKPSVEEQLRILGNREWARGVFDDVDGDADGKDDTDLSGSVDHFKTGLVTTGAISSGMYSALEARIDRAWQRNVREEMRQVQISIIEDREEKKRKAEEDAEEEFEGSVDRVKAEAKREREREAWAQSTHRFGNVEMTGEEWDQLADKLKSDPVLRKWLLGKMKKDGMTDAEALTMYDKVVLATEMQSLPKSHWTPAMKALDQEMKNDPKLNETIKGYVHDTATNKMSGLNVTQDAVTRSATGQASVKGGAEAFEHADDHVDLSKLSALNRAVVDTQKSPTTDQPLKDGAKSASGVDARPFPTAPDLGAHYDKAVVATEPLDGVKELKVASNDVKAQPVPGGLGGLEG